MSSTPDTTACGSASPSPAGPVIGQAEKHAPHLVQASSMSSTRPASAVSNPVLSMVEDSNSNDLRMRANGRLVSQRMERGESAARDGARDCAASPDLPESLGAK